MYEMEGALCGLAAPDRPVARLPRRCAPPARAKHPREPPVSRLFPRPRVAPGWCPFPTVNVFLPACASVAQEPTGIHFEFFLHPHVAHRKRAVIRTLQRLSTALCTNHPQVTRGKLAHTIVRPFQAITCLQTWAWCPVVGPPSWLRARSGRSARSRAAEPSDRRGRSDRRGGSGLRGRSDRVVRVASRCRGRPPPRCRGRPGSQCGGKYNCPLQGDDLP